MIEWLPGVPANTLAGWYFKSIVAQAQLFGLPEITAEKISPDWKAIEDTDRIPVERAADILDATAEATGQDDIALRMGDSFETGQLTDLEKFALSAESYEEAIGITLKYPGIRQSVSLLEIVHLGNGSILTVCRSDYPDPERIRRFMEILMARLHKFAYTILRRVGSDTDSLFLQAIQFRHATPSWYRTYTEVFAAPCTFDADVAGYLVPAASLDVRSMLYAPDTLAFLRTHMDAYAEQAASSTPFSDQVKTAIRELLGVCRPTQITISTKLELSPSRLKSRLQSEDMTLRNAIQDVLRERCIELIEDQISLSEVALQLGYSDQPSFNRAFKRWFGVSPSGWIKQSA